MKKIKPIHVTNALEIERAIEPGERRRILDAADFLPQTGGRSKSRRSLCESRPAWQAALPERLPGLEE